MKLFIRALAVVLAAVLLSACGGQPAREGGEVVVEDRGAAAGAEEGVQGAEEGAEARALPGQQGVLAYPMEEDPSSPLSKRVIYFDYDKSEIPDEYRPVIQAHANFMASNPRARVTLEGHTDERGSREYNVALGERRAESVRRLMLFMGAVDDQIQTVSYGEERPVALGHEDSAWQQNRRVEIIYQR